MAVTKEEVEKAKAAARSAEAEAGIARVDAADAGAAADAAWDKYFKLKKEFINESN